VGVVGIDGSLLEWAMDLVKCGGDFRRGSIDGDGEGHGRRVDMEGERWVWRDCGERTDGGGGLL
jgi:hypothetical protein